MLEDGDSSYETAAESDDSPKDQPFLEGNAIASFIHEVATKREKSIQERFTAEYINSIGFDTSLLVSAVKVISEAPTSNQLREIIQQTDDKKLLYQLQNPDVSLGISVRDQSENGDFDLFENILGYKKKEGLNIKEHDTIVTFINESKYWIPPIIEIDDEDLYKDIRAGIGIENYSYLGKCYYNRVVNEYLIQRFDDRNLKLLSYHTTNKKIFKQWAYHYDLSFDETFGADQAFLAYLGALATSIQYNDKEYEIGLRNWIMILLEPLLLQFESSDPVKFNAIEDLKVILKGDLKFEILYESTHEIPQVLVRIKAGNHMLTGSTRSANAVFDAQTRASSAVLYNPVLKQSAIDLIEKESVKQASASPFTGGASTSANPSATAQPQLRPQVPVQPQVQPQMDPPGPYQPQQQAPLPAPQQQFAVATSGVNNQFDQGYQDPSGMYSQAIANEEHQRLQHEAELNILEAPIVEDEKKIDPSSKEKLNQMLIKKRIGTAEYKTAKLNNSDVQVTCYIENAPIAKATSTNKKKAGHIVAQYIMNYPEYFLHRFKGRV